MQEASSPSAGPRISAAGLLDHEGRHMHIERPAASPPASGQFLMRPDDDLRAPTGCEVADDRRLDVDARFHDIYLPILSVRLMKRILPEVSPQVKRGWGVRAGRRARRKACGERNRGGGGADGECRAAGGAGGVVRVAGEAESGRVGEEPGGRRRARGGHSGGRPGRRGGAGTDGARAPRRGGRTPRGGAAARSVACGVDVGWEWGLRRGARRPAWAPHPAARATGRAPGAPVSG